jgi:steroid 5-alpha reductase family enzyme
MTPPYEALAIAGGVAIAAKTLAWLAQLRTRNAGMVDPVWAFTLGGLAVLVAAVGSAPVDTRVALALMGGFWGLRLGAHLWSRNAGKPEDCRYAQFRAKWGARANFNLFWFFQFQNLFSLALVATAFLPVAYRHGPAPFFGLLTAAALWLVAVIGEGVADRQLERFRANPMNKGRVCRDGLWRYSRHPNYFFECVHWLAYFPLTLGSPVALVALAAPAIMGTLLLKLSGVPLLEAEMAKRKPGYAEYMRTTSVLVPLPPK